MIAIAGQSRRRKGGEIAGGDALEHAPGTSLKDATYLFFWVSNSGELGGDTSSVYVVEGVAYEVLGKREVTWLGEGWE